MMFEQSRIRQGGRSFGDVQVVTALIASRVEHEGTVPLSTWFSGYQVEAILVLVHVNQYSPRVKGFCDAYPLDRSLHRLFWIYDDLVIWMKNTVVLVI
jgi:hypothetical protein